MRTDCSGRSETTGRGSRPELKRRWEGADSRQLIRGGRVPVCVVGNYDRGARPALDGLRMETIVKSIVLLAVAVLVMNRATPAQVTFRLTRVDVPNSTFTRAHNINRYGDIVGLFNAGGSGHGFLRHNGQFTQIDYPGATFTSARGINSQGDIVGGYADDNNADHGFLLANVQYTVIDFPSAASTALLKFEVMRSL